MSEQPRPSGTVVVLRDAAEHLELLRLEPRRCDDALASLAGEPVLTFRPRVCSPPERACMLYPGDAGDEAGDLERPGPRHRLWARPGGWRYERG
jgi:hypothetical protein